MCGYKKSIILLASLLLCCEVFGGIKGVKLQGVNYVNVKDIAETWGMHFSIEETPRSKAKLKSKWTTLEFSVNDRSFLLNGVKVFLGSPIMEQRHRLYVSKKDYKLSISPILSPQSFSPKPKLYHIMIDPGHGGKDEGATNMTLHAKEKDLSLQMALMLEQQLKKSGYKVTLTRRQDTFVPLAKRSEFANKHKVDLFISLHVNSAEAKEAQGIETFVYTNPNQPSTGRSNLLSDDKLVNPANSSNPWSTLAGYYVQSSLSKSLGAKDRGLRRARFAVLKDLECPGILIETGFLSNPTESKALTTTPYQGKLVNAIAKGLATYQKTLNRIRKEEKA